MEQRLQSLGTRFPPGGRGMSPGRLQNAGTVCQSMHDVQTVSLRLRESAVSGMLKKRNKNMLDFRKVSRNLNCLFWPPPLMKPKQQLLKYFPADIDPSCNIYSALQGCWLRDDSCWASGGTDLHMLQLIDTSRHGPGRLPRRVLTKPSAPERGEEKRKQFD